MGGRGGGGRSSINGDDIYLSANYERNRCFLIPLCHLILRIANLEVANKRLFHQQVKILRQFHCHIPHESVSRQLFLVVQIFQRFLRVICYVRQVLSEGHKNFFKDWCLMNSQPTFLIWTYFLIQGNGFFFFFFNCDSLHARLNSLQEKEAQND